MSAATPPASVSKTRSPFLLLREETEAEHVLILTYTANLEFFERFALGETRGLQATSAIISDATMVIADPVTVTSAGVRYLDGRAVCPGGTAFHPKLLAIVGDKRATVAIGSGNLTISGWHANDELWTVLHADDEHGPDTVRDVSRFLRQLVDGRIQLSVEAPYAITRVAERLDGLAADQSGPQLVSTLDDTPIYQRLPVGPVDELIVYSPYYDAELAALTAVHRRLQPENTTVLVQEQTSVHGSKLNDWLAEHGGKLAWCSPERFRHGKLIEWRQGDTRQALTGSPNVSAPALLRIIPAVDASESDGLANCELGLIHTVSASLAPAEMPAPASGAAGLKFSPGPDAQRSAGMLLLGAELVNGAEVHLRLATPLLQPARVQVHDEEHDWRTAPGHDQLPAGATDYRVPAIGLLGGTALRLYGSTGASNEVFVVDPARVQRRPYRRIGPEHDSVDGMIVNGELGDLYEIAELLRPHLLKIGAYVPKPKPAAGGAGAPAPSDDDQPAAAKPGQTLEEYLDACSAVVDERIVKWALGIPSIPQLAGETTIDRQAGVLTDEISDDAADAGTEADSDDQPNLGITTADITAKRRQQWRTFCNNVLPVAVEWPAVMRALIARLVLLGISKDLWPTDAERAAVLSRLVELVASDGDGDEPNDDQEVALANYAALTLALLRRRVRHLAVNDEPMLAYRAAGQALSKVVQNIDPQRLDSLLADVATAFDHAVSTDEMFDIAVHATTAQTGIPNAVSLMAGEYGISSTELAGELVLNEPITELPERALVRAAGLVEGVDPVVIRAPGTALMEWICVWHPPHLLIARVTLTTTNGRVYRLPHMVSLKAIYQSWSGANVAVSDNLPKPIEDWLPGRSVPSIARELLGFVKRRAGGSQAEICCRTSQQSAQKGGPETEPD